MASWDSEVRIFYSLLIEPDAQFTSLKPGEMNRGNLARAVTCEDVRLDYSEYWMYNVEYGYGAPNCTMDKYSDDSYSINLRFKNVEIPEQFADKLENSYIRVSLDSNPNAIIHFVYYDLKCVWKYYKRYEEHFSQAKGVFSPNEGSMYSEGFFNQTLGFKGPHESVLNMRLTPGHYNNQNTDVEYRGYWIEADKSEVGDTVNRRTATMKYRSGTELNQGFNFEIRTNLN